MRAWLAVGASIMSAIGVTVAPDARAIAPTPAWTSPTTLTADGTSDPTLNNDHIDTAMGAGGDAAVAWLSGMANGNGPGAVSVATRAARGDATWEVRTVTAGALALAEPRVAVGGNGDAIVAWIQADGLYAAYRPAGVGQEWSTPQEIAASSNHAQCGYDSCAMWGFSIAMDPDGNAIAGWNQPTWNQTGAGTPSIAYRASGADSVWSNTEYLTVNGSTPTGSTPLVKFDDSGDALVALGVCSGNCYTGGYPGLSWGIYYADRPHDDGVFGTNDVGGLRALVTSLGSNSYVPALELAVGPDGSAAAAWSQSYGQSYLAYRPAGAATFDAASSGMYGTVSVGPDGTAFAAQSGSDHVHAPGTGQSWSGVDTGPFIPRARYDAQYVPSGVAIDASGDAVVVGSQNNSVNYQCCTVAAVRGTDGSWSTLHQLSSDSATEWVTSALSQRVASDALGDASVAWVELVNGKWVVRVAGLVGGPGLRALKVPPTAITGDAASLSVEPRDVWQTIADSDVTWTFAKEGDASDSETVTGPTVNHVFAHSGTYDVTVVAVDSAGASVTSPVKQVTVTEPSADLTADVTSGTAPLTVHLDAGGSAASSGATFEFFCGDTDGHVAAASSDTTATCRFDRESPDGGWTASVTMHDPATGADYHDTVNIAVAPKPNTVDDSSAFDGPNADDEIVVADDGSLTSDTCSDGQHLTYCTTLDGSSIYLTAAPGTFAPGTHVLIYHGDTAALQSELGSNVEAQGGFAVTWTPRATLTQPLIVTIPVGSSTTSTALLHPNLMRPAFDLGGFFSGVAAGIASGATAVVSTIGSFASAAGNAIVSAGTALWTAATQAISRPNNSSVNNVIYCAKIHVPRVITALDPARCDGPFEVVQNVGTDEIQSLSGKAGVIAAGGGNVIAAGGGNVIAAGGGNVIAAGGGNVIAAGGGNIIPSDVDYTPDGGSLMMVNTVGVIAAGGGNVIAAGGGNFASVGGGNLTFGLVRDPGIAFVQPTSTAPPTVTAATEPAVPDSGYYSSGPVTVHLHAVAADGATIKNVSYEASGAERILDTVVDGANADVEIDQPGSTTITYTAQDDSLSRSELQSVTVDIVSPPAAPTGVNATRSGPTSATVSWTAPPDPEVGPITGYTVEVIDTGTVQGGDGEPVRDVAFDSTATSEDIDGLTADHVYVFTVTANNGVDGATSDPSSDGLIAGAVPGAVTGLTTSESDGQVALQWTAPDTDGGIPLNNYLVYRSTTSGGPYTRITTSDLDNLPTTTSFADDTVTNGTTYYYVVTAENALGESSYSDEASGTPATVPTAPTISGITPGNQQVTVSFSPSGADGGSAVTGYTVSAEPTGGGDVITGAATGSPYTLSGLTNGVTYDVTVVAHNRMGDSPSSAAQQATPSAPPPAGASGPPGLGYVASATSIDPATDAFARSTSSAGDVAATGHGAGTVTVGQYAEQPPSTGAPTFGATGSYIDVFVTPGSAFDSVDVDDCDLGGGRALYWWDPATAAWLLVQPQQFHAGPPACVSVTLTDSSVPTLSQLTGTVFAAATPATPTITSVAPASLLPGRTTTVTVAGSGFEPGADVSTGGGSGVTVTGRPIVSAGGSLLTVRLTAGHSARPGAVAMTVTNPDTGWATCGGCLAVAYQPSVTVAPLRRVVRSGHATVSYHGAETGGRFSAWTTAHTARSRMRLHVGAGQTLCVAVRSRDRLGQTSAWSTARCTSRPVPVADVQASRSWVRHRGGAYSDGSTVVTHTQGATLRLPDVRPDLVGLVVTRGPHCGRVAVSIGNELLGTLDLRARHAHPNRTMFLPAKPHKSGTLVVTSLTRGTVAVQGIVVARVRAAATGGPALRLTGTW